MSDPSAVRVESTVTRSGYVAVVVLTFVSSPILLFVLAGALLAGTTGALGSGAVAIAIAFPLSVPAVALLTYARTFTKGAREVFEPAVWTFQEMGVDVEARGEARFAEWDTFVRWRRVAGHYLLNVDRSRYVVVAGESLGAADRECLEAMLQAKVPPRSGAWLRG